MPRPMMRVSSFAVFLLGVTVGCLFTVTFSNLRSTSEHWLATQTGPNNPQIILGVSETEGLQTSQTAEPVRPVEDPDDFEGDGEFLSLISDDDEANAANSSALEVDDRMDDPGTRQIGMSPVVWDDVDEKYKLSEGRILEQKKLWREGKAEKPLFFFYQPSGGWGNQRYELMWAIIAANAMNRTLILPPIAPHSNRWYGYNRWKPSALLPMARVLNMQALERVVDRGVISFNDTTNAISGYLPNLNIFTYERPEEAGWWSYQKIQRDWAGPERRKYDVIFWSKSSMWCCCGATGPYKNYYSWHVMFNSHIKQFARRLIREAVFDPISNPNATFNAVHVRRGDHVTGDRRTPLRYWRDHDLGKFDRRYPLYVATDETDRSWFAPWEAKPSLKRFSRMIFWTDLRKDWIEQELKLYPKELHGDVLGFIEIMICSYARRWEGSNGSTFSQAILRTRSRKELRAVVFDWPPRPLGSP